MASHNNGQGPDLARIVAQAQARAEEQRAALGPRQARTVEALLRRAERAPEDARAQVLARIYRRVLALTRPADEG